MHHHRLVQGDIDFVSSEKCASTKDLSTKDLGSRVLKSCCGRPTPVVESLCRFGLRESHMSEIMLESQVAILQTKESRS